MRQYVLGIAIFLLLSATCGIAQSTVTTSGGSANTVPVFTGSTTVGDSPISTTSGGNVGIGTTSPTEFLTSAGAIRILPLFPKGSGSGAYVYSDDTNAFLDSYGPNTATQGSVWLTSHKSDGSGGYTMGKFSPTQITFNAPLNVTGAVGIGTTAPSEPLEVNGNTKVDGTLAVSGTGGLEVQNGGITFPDGTTQTTAYPASSSGGSAPVQVENNEAVINNGVSSNGSGLKHISTNQSCTTGSSSGQGYSCSIVITWPGTPFLDANYTVTCTPKAVSAGSQNWVPYNLTIPDANKTTTTTTVVFTETANDTAGTLSGLNCIAIHD